MKSKTTKNYAALALACALAFPPAADGAEGIYKNLSARIARCSAENAVARIAVLDFAAKGGAGKKEAEYAAESVGLALAGGGAPALIERSQLDKVLKEARLSSSAGGAADSADMLREIFSIDAVVTGAVFADGETLKVFTKLIDIKSGRVLLAAETETRRMEPDPLKSMFDSFELDEVPVPELPAGWGGISLPRFSANLRDAVADPQELSCIHRRGLLIRMDYELVDAKAWYWARRMRNPGFTVSSLTRNPGSEIADPDIKARFYKLLAGYAGYAGGARPEPEKLIRVMELLRLEKEVADECSSL